MEFWLWFVAIITIIVIGQRGVVFAAASSLVAGVLLPSAPALFVAVWLAVGAYLIWG